MRHAVRNSILTALAFLPVDFFCCGSITVAAVLKPPPLCILDSNQLIDSKKRIGNNDSTLRSAATRLERDANHSLAQEPFGVTQKELAPPSGDKHDYMSVAPYWWPNPKTKNGLPYVRRDGEINAERDQTSDHKRLDNLVQSVKSLALAYFLTDREEYAAHAAKLLRVWFLDDATKMNPNLRYAQAVPGRNQGRGAGIIETHNLPELLDAVGLLGNSKSWKQADQKSLQNWFSTYLTWLLESSEGKTEAKSQNNHGTWYDAQVACFALFVGWDEIAKKIMAEFPVKRIAKQIETDGRQPQELARAQSWNYAIFNLEAFFAAAAIADKVGVDLWHYEATDKRSIRKALDSLVPFAIGEKKWTYPQITPFEAKKLAPLLRRASLVFRESAYEKVITKLPKVAGDERWELLHPKMSEPK